MGFRAAASLLPFLFVCTALAGDPVNRGWFVYSTVGWLHEPDPSTWEAQIEDTVGPVYGISPDSITVLTDTYVSPDPSYNQCNLPAFLAGLPLARIDVIESHDVMCAYGLMVELMDSNGHPDDRVLALAQQCNLESWTDITYSSGVPLSPGQANGYAIVLTGAGIRKIATASPPYTVPEFIMFAMSCNSAEWADDWGVGPLSDSPGKSYLGYNGETNAIISALDLFSAIDVLACNHAFVQNNTVSDIPLVSTNGEWSGWKYNRVNPGWSCNNIAGFWYHTSAYDGQVRIAYVGEESASVYHVLADGDTVATFDGRGTDGYGRLRCYSASVPATAQCFLCLEVDNLGHPTYSDEFTWGEEGEEWPVLQPLEDFTMAEVDSALGPPVPDDPWEPGDPCWDFAAARDAWLSGQSQEWIDHGSFRELVIGPSEPVEMCGDVLVYKVRGTPFSLGTAGYQIQQDFPGKFVRLIEASTDDPEQARACLELVAQANAQYGGGQYPVDPGPTLILVGESGAGGVQPMLIPDNPAHSCHGYAYCFTYSLIGDIYGEDGIPDCPVQVIPAFTDDELTKMCMFAHQWNDGIDVNTNGGGALLLWDWDGVGPNPGMTPVTLQILDAYNGQSSNPSVLLQRSAHPEASSTYVCKGLIELAFAYRPRDVWCIGYESYWGGQHIPWLCSEYFEAGPFLELNQVVMVHAPACYSAKSGSAIAATVSRHMLVLAESGATRAAGFLGQLNAGYDCEHADFALAFRNALGNAPEGALYDLVVHDAITTAAEQNPHYAVGVQWLGSLTKVRSELPPGTSAPESGGEQERSGLWASPGEGVTGFHFSLSVGAHIRLTVLDVQGRVVARVREGWHAPGRYTYSWFQKDQGGRPVPNGVYFGRMEVGQSSGKPWTVQVTVAR
jgi:hypothetical protein